MDSCYLTFGEDVTELVTHAFNTNFLNPLNELSALGSLPDSSLSGNETWYRWKGQQGAQDYLDAWAGSIAQ